MSSKLDVCIAACAGAVPSTSIHEIREALAEAQARITELEAALAISERNTKLAWRQAGLKDALESYWRHEAQRLSDCSGVPLRMLADAMPIGGDHE